MVCTRYPIFYAPVNPEDKIGAVKTIPHGCAPAGGAFGWMKKYMPSNGEYEWAGEGNYCHYCSIDYPDSIDCESGCADIACCSILGKRGTYKRKSYNADPKQCCLRNAEITSKSNVMIGDLTCDPKYRSPASPDCYPILREYCLNGTTLMTDHSGICRTWCSNNQKECNSYKSKICNNIDNFNQIPECKTWCAENDGLCDTSGVDYCSKETNKEDDFCSCLNSDLVQYKFNPLCEDRKCIKNGYATQSMITSRGKGCEIIDCTTYLEMANKGKTDFKNVAIYQHCGDKTPASVTPKPISSTNKLIIVIIVMILWIILTLLFMYLIKRRT